MSKKMKPKVTIAETVMDKVKTGQITMKPKWCFVLGSIFMGLGVLGLSIVAIFLFNLSFFLLRQHGPMGEWRLQAMLESFPWWIPILGIVGSVIGVRLLKKYDFSYKQNFSLIVVGFIGILILAAFIINATGINDTWSRKGPMRGLYQRYQIDRQDGRIFNQPSRKHMNLKNTF